MGKFSLKGLKGLGGKAKGGFAKTFGDLYKKRGITPTEVKHGEEGLAALGDFAKMTAKEAGREEYGRGGEKQSIFSKIKGGFGKAKGKYSEWSAKRSEAARKKNYFTVRKCPKCGKMHTGAEPCPATGKPEPGASSADEEIERIKEFYEGKKKIGLNTQNIGKKIGGVIASGVMMTAAYGGAFLYFPEFAQLVLIIGGVALAFIIISMFVKNAGGYLFLGFFAMSGFTLWQVGILTPYIDQYLPPVVDAFQNMWTFGSDIWFNTQCIISNPANADACMEARQRNATESVNKLGPYETVEIKWGRRLDGDYDTDPVESGQDYNLEVSFFNKNNAVYEINFTQINAYTTVTEDSTSTEMERGTKAAFEKYTLDPKEELPIRFKEFDFADDWVCEGSQTFKVNVTTEQKSGGWSDFGMAPSDEDNFRKFIHGFKPNKNAEPGPLNIYVYTDPCGISAEDFIGVPDDDKVEVIILIQNKVKSGTAEIKELYLVQEFEVPDKLFDIIGTSCEGTKFLEQPSNLTVDTNLPSGLCSSGPSARNNCLRFYFPNTLILKPNEKVTIACKIDNIKIPTNEYTDQIRVFANFNYIQQWTNTIPCMTYT